MRTAAAALRNELLRLSSALAPFDAPANGDAPSVSVAAGRTFGR